MSKKIVVLAGDGIGQDIMPQALKVLNHVMSMANQPVELVEGYIGGSAYDRYGDHFPAETKALCQDADAILFGSVGGPIQDAHLPKWQNCEVNSILALRKTFQLNANLRTARVYPELIDICPLQKHIVDDGIDILIVRELIGDIYFGEHKRYQQDNMRCASDMAVYTEKQIFQVAEQAFQTALGRGKKITSVDKANVLDTSRLWREVVTEVARDYPQVTLEHMLVDNCAMQLFINPGQFDVILTANLFGDILSDAASAIPGSLGLMPSASLNQAGFALYEPAGGSAPDIAGLDVANPIGQILSVAMMMQYTFHLPQLASAIEQGVQKTLEQGYGTKDICTQGKTVVGTTKMTDIIIKNMTELEVK